MKLTKKLTTIVAVVIVGFLLNVIVTAYTAKTGNISAETNQGCRGVGYIVSGFPIRDVYVQDFNSPAGDCGFVYIHKGNTRLGAIPFTLNWVFWSGLIFLTPIIIKRSKKQ